MHARKPKPKPGGAAVPKRKRPVFRDLSVYSRTLKLPAFATEAGIVPLSKNEISADFRSIANLPLLPPDLAGEDELLADPKVLAPELRAKLPSEPPEPEAAPSKTERPQVIQALETAAFEDVDGDEEDASTVFQPARVMSGWVAARIMGEQASAAAAAASRPGRPAPDATALGSSLSRGLLLDGAPGVLSWRGGAEGGLPFGGGWGSGPSGPSSSLPVAMGPVRLELSLKERLAALGVRREERDKRYLALRRYYVASLRNYHLETKEHYVALEALRDETAAARAEARPNRPMAAHFATDEEEWAAAGRMAQAAYGVWRQNSQLRARLAQATGRTASAAEYEPSERDADAPDAANDRDVVVLQLRGEGDGPSVAIGGGAKGPARKRRRAGAGAAADAPSSSSSAAAASRPAAKRRGGEEEGSEDEGGPGGAGHEGGELEPYAPPVPGPRSAPRTSVRASLASGTPPLLALGDLVATPYGRGVVIRQREADDVAEVRLAWAATAFLPSAAVALLATAGEDYSGPLSGDAGLCAGPLSPVPRGLSASAATWPSADELIYGGSGGVEGAAGSKRPRVQPAPSSSSSSAAAIPRASAGAAPSSLDNLHGGGTVAALRAELEEEGAASVRATRKLKTKAGTAITNRQVVFRSSWAGFGAPRGTLLRVDLARGAPGHGFVTGSADGLGDGQYFSRWGAPGAGATGLRGGLPHPSAIAAALQAQLTALLSAPGPSSSSSSSLAAGLMAQGGLESMSSPRHTGMGGGHLGQGAGAATAASIAAAAIAGALGSGAGATGYGPSGLALGPSFASVAAGAGAAGQGAGPVGQYPPSSSSSAAAPPAPGAPAPSAPGGLGAARSELARLRGEVQRLTFQLRTAEDSRVEQRRRLTDARVTSSRLLEQLNEARSALSSVAREMGRRDEEIEGLQARLGRMYERFAPEAERKGWEGLRAAALASSPTAASAVAAAGGGGGGEPGGEPGAGGEAAASQAQHAGMNGAAGFGSALDALTSAADESEAGAGSAKGAPARRGRGGAAAAAGAGAAAALAADRALGTGPPPSPSSRGGRGRGSGRGGGRWAGRAAPPIPPQQGGTRRSTAAAAAAAALALGSAEAPASQSQGSVGGRGRGGRGRGGRGRGGRSFPAEEDGGERGPGGADLLRGLGTQGSGDPDYDGGAGEGEEEAQAPSAGGGEEEEEEAEGEEEEGLGGTDAGGLDSGADVEEPDPLAPHARSATPTQPEPGPLRGKAVVAASAPLQVAPPSTEEQEEAEAEPSLASQAPSQADVPPAEGRQLGGRRRRSQPAAAGGAASGAAAAGSVPGLSAVVAAALPPSAGVGPRGQGRRAGSLVGAGAVPMPAPAPANTGGSVFLSLKRSRDTAGLPPSAATAAAGAAPGVSGPGGSPSSSPGSQAPARPLSSLESLLATGVQGQQAGATGAASAAAGAGTGVSPNAVPEAAGRGASDSSDPSAPLFDDEPAGSPPSGPSPGVVLHLLGTGGQRGSAPSSGPPAAPTAPSHGWRSGLSGTGNAAPRRVTFTFVDEPSSSSSSPGAFRETTDTTVSVVPPRAGARLGVPMPPPGPGPSPSAAADAGS